MKKLFTLMALGFICTAANAQSDSARVTKEGDTIRIGNIIIINNGNKTDDNKNFNTHITFGRSHKKKLSNVSTNWVIVDLGFANYADKTNYGTTGSYLYNRAGALPLGKSDFKLNTPKSINVNIWFFMQRQGDRRQGNRCPRIRRAGRV